MTYFLYHGCWKHIRPEHRYPSSVRPPPSSSVPQGFRDEAVLLDSVRSCLCWTVRTPQRYWTLWIRSRGRGVKDLCSLQVTELGYDGLDCNPRKVGAQS